MNLLKKILHPPPNIHSDPLVNMLKNFTGLKKFWKHPTYSDMGGTYICCEPRQKNFTPPPNIHSDPLVNMLKNFTGLKKFWEHQTYSDMGGTYICCDLLRKKKF